MLCLSFLRICPRSLCHKVLGHVLSAQYLELNIGVNPMARYKLIRPTFEDPEFKLAKKRERIKEISAGIWGVLITCGILVGGLHQENDLVTGWLFIVLGLISFAFTLFCVFKQCL